MPIPSAKVIAALEKQADHEFLASQNYLAMSYWCEAHQHSGFASFFKKQAGEEMEHANKILKHLADRDVLPKIGAVAAPANNFKALVEVAQAAYDFERANTAGIHSAYEVALAEKDYPAQVMLHWFIAEQVEEEAWSDKLLVKTREAGCAGALMNLDRHLEKILNSDSAES
jgi:ferritin